MTDAVSTTKSATQSLDDSLSITDQVSTQSGRTQSLADSLAITDAVSTPNQHSNLYPTHSTSPTQSLLENQQHSP